MSTIEKNTVSAQAQIRNKNVEIVENGGKYKVLFIGNSITRHGPKPDIGWEHDWGMAASAREKDYVHVAVKLLEEKLGKIDYAIANCADWESHYYDDEKISVLADARAFCADIVVIRLGENMWSAHENFAKYPIGPHFVSMVEYVCSNPSAQVIVTDLFWKNPTIDDAIHTAAKAKGYTLVTLGDLGDEKENMAIGKFWHEGVALHPGDNGMQKIAERIVEKIDKSNPLADF